MSCAICKLSRGCAIQKEESLSYHRVPKHEDVKKKWLDFCGAKIAAKSDRMVLCSRHFEPGCIKKQAFACLLKPGSVPTLFPPAEPESRQEEIMIVCKPDLDTHMEYESGQVLKEMTGDYDEPEQTSPSPMKYEERQVIEKTFNNGNLDQSGLPEENVPRHSLSSVMPSTVNTNVSSKPSENSEGAMEMLLKAIKASSRPPDSKSRLTVVIPVRTAVKKPSSLELKERRQMKLRLRKLESRKEKLVARNKELASLNKKLRAEVKRLKNRKPKPPTVAEICGHLQEKVSETFIALLRDQLKNFDVAPCGRRWSDLTREFALSIYKASPAAYRKLGDTMDLPTSRSLASFRAQALTVSTPEQIKEVCLIPQEIECPISEQVECSGEDFVSNVT